MKHYESTKPINLHNERREKQTLLKLTRKTQNNIIEIIKDFSKEIVSAITLNSSIKKCKMIYLFIIQQHLVYNKQNPLA